VHRAAFGLALGLLAAIPATASAQPSTEATVPELRIEVLTAEPGDQIWERFGHNALRVVDEGSGLDVAWNWGVFDFEQEGFLGRLLRGTMLYQVAPYPTEAALREYAAAGRAVWTQELDLTPAEAQFIERAALENYRPENRHYRYDYYRDNCSTRIRDILDGALGGQIRDVTGGVVTETSYRWQTRRLLGPVFWAYTGIQLVLGNRADEPITEWEEMFVPMNLRDHLSRTMVDRGGLQIPLVREARLLLPSARPPVPARPPRRWPSFLAIGLLWSGIILVLAKVAAGGAWLPRAATVLLAGGWSLMAGAGGLVLVLAWAFTDHVFWGWNENVLQTDPLSLLVAVGWVPLLVGRGVPGWVATLASSVAALSLLGFALQAVPGLDQVNAEILVATVPVNVAVAVAARGLVVPGRLHGPSAERTLERAA